MVALIGDWDFEPFSQDTKNHPCDMGITVPDPKAPIHIQIKTEGFIKWNEDLFHSVTYDTKLLLWT